MAELMADVLGATPDDSLLALADDMRGNPLYLIELLRGLREEHLVSLDAGRAMLTEARLPVRVRENMRRRLAYMSPACPTGRSASGYRFPPGTIGYHLYRMFPKLGITSRAELGTVIAETASPDEAGSTVG